MKQISANIKNKKLFLLDIDGTVAFDTTLIEGAAEFFNKVIEKKGKYIFITNNSTKSIQDYVDKFTKMGVTVDKTSFITSSYATALYLKEKYNNQLIHVLGTRSFINELRDFELNITEGKEKNIVAAVVGFDNELNYGKIENICELLETRKIDYIATNPDLVCPVGYGFVPDCGAICDMLSKAVKREPLYIGKPNPLIVDLSIKSTGFTKEETIVIGDRLYTDISCGINAGIDTAVVFTGEAKPEDLEMTKFKPTYYCESIKEILECI